MTSGAAKLPIFGLIQQANDGPVAVSDPASRDLRRTGVTMSGAYPLRREHRPGMALHRDARSNEWPCKRISGSGRTEASGDKDGRGRGSGSPSAITLLSLPDRAERRESPPGLYRAAHTAGPGSSSLLCPRPICTRHGAGLTFTTPRHLRVTGRQTAVLCTHMLVQFPRLSVHTPRCSSLQVRCTLLYSSPYSPRPE